MSHDAERGIIMDSAGSLAIPKHLQEKVDKEIKFGERIQWIGMPIPKFFTPHSTGWFLFGMWWTVFFLIGMVSMWFLSGYPGFAALGVPAILFGFGMVSNPLFAYMRALNTIYVITERRAIVFDGGLSDDISSYHPEKMMNISVKEKKNGLGNVIFSRRTWYDFDGAMRYEELGFFNIRSPKKIELMLRKLAEQSNLSGCGIS